MFVTAAALLLSAQQPVGAQPAPEPENEIVVTGQGGVTVQEARRHVNAIATARQGQLARFHSPVCPTVIGMEPRHAEVAIARMREVAAAAGVETGEPGCRPNMALVVTPNGRLFVEALRRARPQLFSRMEQHEVRRLLNDEGPVRAWSSNEIFNEEGVPVTGAPGSTPTLRVYTASILHEPTQWATLQSVVVVDDDAADGKSLGQLADYAVMRTLAGARPPAASAARRDTILGLFDEGGQAPEALTAMDEAFLTALYRSNPRQSSMRQMAEMSRLIARSAEEAGEGESAQSE